jgi:uncharacterized protein (TIGR02996 family)
MSDDAKFLRALQDAPEDDSVRLVYADWLEERGDVRGEFLRLDTALAKMPQRGNRDRPQHGRLLRLRETLDREWVVTVSRSPHDVVKRLHVTTYPSAGGPWRSEEVKAPSWAEVETALRRLDRCLHPFIWLLLEEDEDGRRFDVIGGEGAYVMAGDFGEGERRYHNPAGGDGHVDVWTSDQGYSAPEAEVCRDLATVIRAAKYVYYFGTFAPGLTWA